MPYTLSMGLLWVALAVLLGIVIGWLMRSVVAKRQVERVRANHLDTVELERLRGRVAELESVVADRDRLRAELDASRAREESAAATTGGVGGGSSGGSSATVESSGVPDLAVAAAIVGAPVELDDLTVIAGIGPKVADLCHGIGIQTWSDLAATEVSLLRTMLEDAGPHVRTQDPSTWPEQAALLAAGRWAEFRQLVDQLAAGRACHD